MKYTLDSRPVIVVGVQHSGTTILNRMIGRHQDLAWFSQYSLRANGRPGRKSFPMAELFNYLTRRTMKVHWRKERNLIARFSPTPIDMDEVLEWMPDNKVFFSAEDCSDQKAKELQTLIAREQRIQRKDRFLLKRPEFTRAVLLLSNIFPEAKFVHIIRDGKAVATSIADKFARSPFGGSNALIDAARYWAETMDYMALCEESAGGQILTIRYEEFCKNVHGTLQKILDHCELPKDRFEFDDLPLILSSTNQKRFNQYSQEERRLIDSVLRDHLLAQGYLGFADEPIVQ